ncbi:hypothetical protein EON64_13220 [archaeon]|nr:MAG: hypothetical protein EON64_13220 [archaeon]
MLWEQDRDDDDGLEQYVRRAIDANEITWFPIRKAIRLDQAASEEEVTYKEISSSLEKLEANLSNKIRHFQSEMSMMLDQLSQATKQEYMAGDVKNGIARYLKEHSLLEATSEDAGDPGSNLLPGTEEGNEELEDDSVLEMQALQGEDEVGGLLDDFDVQSVEEQDVPGTAQREEVEEVFGVQLSLPPSRLQKKREQEVQKLDGEVEAPRLAWQGDLQDGEKEVVQQGKENTVVVAAFEDVTQENKRIEEVASEPAAAQGIEMVELIGELDSTAPKDQRLASELAESAVAKNDPVSKRGAFGRQESQYGDPR